MVALDTRTGLAYPLTYQFTGWDDDKDNIIKKPSYTYSLKDSKVCIMGSQYDGDVGTHETYSNIRNCFHLIKEGKHTSFQSTYINKVQYKYNVKTKTWQPDQL